MTPTLIVSTVCMHNGIDTARFHKRNRADRLAIDCRAVAAYLIRSYLGLSYPQIAKLCGWSDHTTAMYAIDRVIDDAELQESATDIGLVLTLQGGYSA